MESKQDIFEELKKAIMQDEENKSFTDKGWEPIVQASSHAKLLIIGQAPGLKTQEIGGVFHDPSGVRLREWLGVDEDTFYRSGSIAVLPMDFYFPGKGKNGDLPPRKTFAPKWHPRFLSAMPDVEMTILISQYAQHYYLGSKGSKRITDNVFNYEQFLPTYFPLIHPSPRNQIWLSKHSNFEPEVIPALQKRVKEILK